MNGTSVANRCNHQVLQIVEAIDIRKETGFDKAQHMLQNNVILNLVL